MPQPLAFAALVAAIFPALSRPPWWSPIGRSGGTLEPAARSAVLQLVDRTAATMAVLAASGGGVAVLGKVLDRLGPGI